MEKHKLGIVFSGGGARCMGHLGVLKALEEYNIDASCVAGTGAGAVVAALYADGCSAEKGLSIFKESKIFKFRGLNWSKPGLMNTEKYLGFISDYFGDKQFSDLEKELFVVATDLLHGRIKSFSTGNISKPLLASCAMPILYSPVSIEGSLYIGGKVIDNFPVEQIKGKAAQILGLYASHIKKVHKDDLKHSRTVMDRVLEISNVYTSKVKMDWCTWVASPPSLKHYGTFTLSKMDEIFEIGYNHGLQLAPRIREEMIF